MTDSTRAPWSSILEDAARTLVPLLDGPRAVAAARLLAALAPPTAIAALRAVAADPARPSWVRTYAVRALRAAASTPAVDALVVGLLAEQPATLAAWQVLPATTAAQPLDVLALAGATGAAGRAAAARWIDAQGDDLVRWLLLGVLHLDGGPPASIVDHLWRRFRDRVLAMRADDVDPEDVACAVAAAGARDDAADLLEPLWPRIADDVRPLVLHGCPTLAARAAADPARAAVVAATLATPLPALLARDGADAVAARLDAIVRATSLHDRCPELARPDAFAYRAALDLLPRFGAGRRQVATLLVQVALSSRVRGDLLRRLVEVDRGAARRHGAALVAGDPAATRALTRAIARAPVADDRRFLAVAAATADDATRYHAVDGLAWLGDRDATWRGWLGELAATTGGAARIRVLAAAAHAGDRDAAAAIVAACDDADLAVRAEALRWLGTLDDAATPRPASRPRCAPIARRPTATTRRPPSRRRSRWRARAAATRRRR
ncbi:MAG: hypothetical protein H6708_29940 [Kofleriaceae bacterium]|nr:hypothetical protein [Kofleriaceae bacterium]